MSAAHLHLVVNHLPLAALGLGLCLLAVSALWRGADLRKGALILFVAAAVLAAPTYLSGEPAEEEVEHLAGVSESRIEAHEEAAKWAAATTALAGAAALLALVLEARRPAVARRAGLAALLLALVSALSMGRAANLGGQIRHQEIRSGTPAESEPSESH